MSNESLRNSEPTHIRYILEEYLHQKFGIVPQSRTDPDQVRNLKNQKRNNTFSERCQPNVQEHAVNSVYRISNWP